MLIDKNKYRESLSVLWNKVFGDDYSFIDLIFNKEYDSSILCFAELDNEKAVSAFYLIKNELKFENAIFNGYYLYAAATLPEYRGKGLMSDLIRQAQTYCRQQGADYISLVPSQESLYNYYSALGFQKAMHRFLNSGIDLISYSDDASDLNDPEQILDIRRKYNGNIINFSGDSFGYAFDCMKYSGFNFKAFSSDVLFVASGDSDSYSELIAPEAESASEFAKIINSKGTLTSPFKLDVCKKNEIMPYGMIYPVNPRLIRNWNFTDIYMNIALD